MSTRGQVSGAVCASPKVIRCPFLELLFREDDIHQAKGTTSFMATQENGRSSGAGLVIQQGNIGTRWETKMLLGKQLHWLLLALGEGKDLLAPSVPSPQSTSPPSAFKLPIKFC